MERWLVAVILACVVGCQVNPLTFLMRGTMKMVGDMRMAGDMKMSGDMKMQGNMNASMKTDNTASRLASVHLQGRSTAGRIAIVDVDGLLVNKNSSGLGSLGENPVALFREKLDALRMDNNVRGLVLRINSPGGGVTATDIMSRDLQQFRADTQIPIVACLLDVGAGGAYYLASHADVVIAHPTSIVGGIGVILNVYNLEDAMGQFNIASKPIKSGDQIDIASPEREMDKGERESLQAIANQFHQRFIKHVKSARPASAARPANFDGGILTGQSAVDAGLVDEVGYLDDAIAWARQRAELSEDCSIIMLRRDNDRAYSQFDVTPNVPYALLPFKMPGLDRSTLPTFLYLWQPDPSFLTGSGG